MIVLLMMIMKWMDGRVSYVIWKENSSWTHHKLGVSAVQLDPNTWLLEYRRSLIFDNPRLVSATLEFLKYRTLRMFEGMKHEFWLSSTYEFKLKFDTKVPTWFKETTNWYQIRLYTILISCECWKIASFFLFLVLFFEAYMFNYYLCSFYSYVNC